MCDLGNSGVWEGDYGWGVRVRRPFGARGMSSVRYGIRLGDLKNKQPTHTVKLVHKSEIYQEGFHVDARLREVRRPRGQKAEAAVPVRLRQMPCGVTIQSSLHWVTGPWCHGPPGKKGIFAGNKSSFVPVSMSVVVHCTVVPCERMALVSSPHSW